MLLQYVKDVVINSFRFVDISDEEDDYENLENVKKNSFHFSRS